VTELNADRSSRAWYAGSITDFSTESGDTILGRLATNGGFALLETQRDAWIAQIAFLRDALRGLSGGILFEYSIPRMGRRIDAVLLTGGIVFVVEFKVGAAAFDGPSIDQVWDYALDLKNFHAGSHHLPIVPLLVATHVVHALPPSLRRDRDGVFRPIGTNPATFRTAIDAALDREEGPSIDVGDWLAAPYRPTPTIIEAARAVYAQHSVESIARHDAGAENLRVTSTHIEELVADAKRNQHKLICFVTGVPGAGKTLVGLNVATRRREIDASSPAVYLSGNGPLVAVLREALNAR
jgi:hypothetical protein